MASERQDSMDPPKSATTSERPVRRNPLAVWGPAVLACVAILGAFVFREVSGSPLAKTLWIAAQVVVGIAAAWVLLKAGGRRRS